MFTVSVILKVAFSFTGWAKLVCITSSKPLPVTCSLLAGDRILKVVAADAGGVMKGLARKPMAAPLSELGLRIGSSP